MRKILRFAVAVGGWSSRHRIVTALAVFAILVVAVGGGVFTARALAPGQSFGGDMAPGAHTFRLDPPDGDDPDHDTELDARFCGLCHADILAQRAADADGHHGANQCVDCHPRQTEEYTYIPHGETEPVTVDRGLSHLSSIGSCAAKGYCHGPGGDHTQAEALALDVHGSLYTDVGETPDAPGWVCMVCHTEVEINMTTSLMGPLQIDLGP